MPPSGAMSAPVWQSDRKAYCAIGGNGEGAAALWAMVSTLPSTALTSRTHGSCQRPCPASSRSASSGPHDPFAYGCTGGGASSSGA